MHCHLLDLFKFLIEVRKKDDIQKAFGYAVRWGRIEAVKYLVESGRVTVGRDHVESAEERARHAIAEYLESKLQ